MYQRIDMDLCGWLDERMIGLAKKNFGQPKLDVDVNPFWLAWDKLSTVLSSSISSDIMKGNYLSEI